MPAPHYLTITDLPDGNREVDWTHPDDCPEGDRCDIHRRTHRMGLESMGSLADGREPGRYLLGRYGFHGLVLIDEQGNVLPDPPIEIPQPYNADDPTPPAEDVLAVAAYEVICEVLAEIAEPLVEDTETALELFEEIRMAQVTDNDIRAIRPRNVLVNNFVGNPAAYTGPIMRLFEKLGLPLPVVPQNTKAA